MSFIKSDLKICNIYFQKKLFNDLHAIYFSVKRKNEIKEYVMLFYLEDDFKTIKVTGIFHYLKSKEKCLFCENKNTVGICYYLDSFVSEIKSILINDEAIKLKLLFIEN